MRHPSAGLVIILCCIAAPTSASAQQAAPPDITSIDGTTDADRAAAELHDRALALHADIRAFPRAARLHLRSAELRDASDPKAVESLSLAAALFWHSGRLSDASAAAEAAAQRALSIGDVFTAANRNVDRAVIAVQLGEPYAARAALRRAHLLSLSPHLTGAQKTHIRNRIR